MPSVKLGQLLDVVSDAADRLAESEVVLLEDEDGEAA
jgi:hypothetical protein